MHTWFTDLWAISHRGPGTVLSSTALTMINTAVLAQCEGKDGGLANDGYLTEPRACNFDPAVLQCKGSNTSNCLLKNNLFLLLIETPGPF